MPIDTKEALPEGVVTKVEPWSMNGYKNFLALADIGIVPNNLGLIPAKLYYWRPSK